MELGKEDVPRKYDADVLAPPKSILDEIGWPGLCVIVWRATPFPLRLIAFPYGVLVYGRLLAASDTLQSLHAMHAREFNSSRLFRLLRPRYHRAAKLLDAYGLKSEDAAATKME